MHHHLMAALHVLLPSIIKAAASGFMRMEKSWFFLSILIRESHTGYYVSPRRYIIRYHWIITKRMQMLEVLRRGMKIWYVGGHFWQKKWSKSYNRDI